MRECALLVELIDYWHCGIGRGAGSQIDAVVDRDDSGMPYVPGRMLKGLLREAVESLIAFGAINADELDGLFGPRLDGERSRHQFAHGTIAVSDARLPVDTIAWLASEDGAFAREQMSRVIYATALDDGVARTHSLRSSEVIIPMQLHATLTGPDHDRWIPMLTRAAQLVQALGAHRSRGLGRCHIQVKEIAHA